MKAFEQQIERVEEIQQMTLSEAQAALGSEVTVGDAVLVVGIGCTFIVAWILFNKFMAFKFGGGKDAG